jgi:protein dithiol oxidoreductase (disulfide-forming)
MKKPLIGWLAAITLVMLSLASPVQAQLVTGKDYVVIDPALPTDDPAKVEVIEFFSYGCPHCNDLYPFVKKWQAKLPADIVFKRVPVSFSRPQWANLAKLYYALEVTGDVGKLDGAVFHALHEEGLNLSTDKNIAEWAVGKGVDAKKFSDAFSSFGVDSKLKRGDQLAASAKIQGVPAFFVDGRYLVVGEGVKSHDDLMVLVDKVVDKARSERNAKKK